MTAEVCETPTFSVVTPVYRPPLPMLEACIESVRQQTYEDWEWILVDDGSGDAQVIEHIRDLVRVDKRVKFIERAENGGIVAATNDGLAEARGAFIALLDHDDTLELDALAQVKAVIDEVQDVDYVYTDERILDVNGRVVFHQTKPGWSPERLRSHMYCCHLSVIRGTLLQEIGGLSVGLDGAQDYDLILRVTERARRVVHIPRPLYNWWQAPASTAGNPDAKPWAYEAGIRAVQAHCERIGISAEVEPSEYLGVQRVRRSWGSFPQVSIVIPTNGSSAEMWGVRYPAVVSCVRSIVELSTWPNYEIVLVEDADTPVEVIEDLIDAGEDHLVRIPFFEEFNFSKKCNLGAIASSSEYLIFLNDDTMVISPDWMQELLGFLKEPDVGMSGAKLLFPDNSVQHAGQFWNRYPGHVHYRMSDDEPGTMTALHVARECSGVTAACAAIRRDVFFEVGGFSERLQSNYNDVDLSLKITQAGYRIVWTPYARLWHFESTSRDPSVGEAETEFIMRRWRSRLDSDPYFVPGVEDIAAQAHFGHTFSPPRYR